MPDSVPVVSVDESTLARFEAIDGLETFRSELRTFLKDVAHKQKEPVTNAHTGWKIDVSWQGYKHASRSRRFSRVQLLSLLATRDLLANAVWVGEEAHRRGRAEVVAAHKFVAPFKLADRVYRVTLTVREYRDGRRYYDRTAVEMTTPASQTGAAGVSQLGHQTLAGVATANISDLLGEVKEFPTTLFQDGAEPVARLSGDEIQPA